MNIDKGRKSFGTKEKALAFGKTLGNRYLACYKVEHTGCVFYIVEFVEKE